MENENFDEYMKFFKKQSLKEKQSIILDLMLQFTANKTPKSYNNRNKS